MGKDGRITRRGAESGRVAMQGLGPSYGHSSSEAKYYEVVGSPLSYAFTMLFVSGRVWNWLTLIPLLTLDTAPPLLSYVQLTQLRSSDLN